MKHQHVMCVLRSFLGKLGLPETGRFFLPTTPTDYHDLMVNHAPNHIVWMQREAAEKNTAVLQLLPYMVIRDKKGNIFTYQRTKGIGEERLLGMKSIGVGGHVDLEGEVGHLVMTAKYDEQAKRYTVDSIMKSLHIEIEEELAGLQASGMASIRPIGFLFDDIQTMDDTTEVKISVGRVHLGVVFEVIVPDVTKLSTNEAELLLCEPINIYRDDNDHTNYENWSAMLLGYYREQRNAGLIDSADGAVLVDATAKRGSFYVYSSNPYKTVNLVNITGIQADLAQYAEYNAAFQEILDEIKQKQTLTAPPAHSPMDQTPWVKN